MTRFIALWPHLHQWQKVRVLLIILRYVEYNRVRRIGEDIAVFLLDWFYIHFVRSIIMRNDQRLAAPEFTHEEIMQYAALFYPEQTVQTNMS